AGGIGQANDTAQPVAVRPHQLGRLAWLVDFQTEAKRPVCLDRGLGAGDFGLLRAAAVRV
ncbi:hypothetical protein ACFFTM_23375, partial [Pseudoduganella plicata]|uniref:hypothetical protein n=1 Tax=Pseudoduganella plicata TaxID=321984 RepID=UPI0035F05AE7